METNRIITGDSFEVLSELPADSVHACVTDPPYGLAFMGRDWDDFEPREYQDWCMEWAEAVKRVLKPGGHLLAFSGNRTHHRLFTGVEDAGFEIRDTLTWHYGSGFPKATDVSKTIDKRADAERDVSGSYDWPDGRKRDWQSHDLSHENTYGEADGPESRRLETEPATPEAKKWDGWKTGLKPATEYVVMARKPFDGATVDCVLEHGTGALNVDGARIQGSDGSGFWPGGEDKIDDEELYGDSRTGGEKNDRGRYPSNVIFDEIEAERLDQDVGETTSCRSTKPHDGYGEDSNFINGVSHPGNQYDETGGPSRYFYTSKATKSERNLDGRIDNSHPTVKPQDLMEWLVKLVTREDQTVLDPFCGSGTTCMAAKELNRQFIGIEKQAKWADVARVRCNLTPDNPDVVRGDDNQQGLEAFSD